MINLIRLANKQAPWLTARRFRTPLVAVALAIVVQPISLPFVGWLGFALLLMAAGSLYSAVSLLPHEQRRLDRVENHLLQLQFDRANKLLDHSPVMHGEPFAIQRDFCRAKFCCFKNDWRGAYTALQTVGQRYLLPREAAKHNELIGFLYFNVGNRRDFIDLFGTDGIDFKTHANSVSAALLKSYWHEVQGDSLRAKAALETALMTAPSGQKQIVLYNNLARLEGLNGNVQEQISHLFNASESLKVNPLPAYYRLVYHNLAITLVREGRMADANKIMGDYFAGIDRSNVQQCLDYSNDCLHVARDLGDQKLIDQAHTLCKNLLPGLLTEEQRIAFHVQELRMLRSDGQPIPDYVRHLQGLVEAALRLPEAEQLIALLDIASDIRFELMARCANRGAATAQGGELYGLFAAVVRQLLALRGTIDSELREIPPALPELRRQWMQRGHSLLKFEVSLQPGIPKTVFQKMFDNLEEMARLWRDKMYVYAEIDAWMIVCDEFIAYREGLGEPFYQDFRPRALSAYHEAEKLLLKDLDRPEHQNQLIGMAYFSWKLGADRKIAAGWLQQAGRHTIRLRHYAPWLRDYYHQVLDWLESGDEAP